ncbi:tRNA-specific 2-thiouridylase [Fomitopsis serialis]|uniref:tRNA-specific 2-thiouridylase n=1 Tax=Fomitopsis serialis TaxID=139415 RepID=UPI002008AEB4|nr:tRNA-specific 2-thiouridylase [Neoantrodia serialis]KAH9917443.1 tRNA-specific 2-thiouridylase [Neoantrodia serialis]
MRSWPSLVRRCFSTYKHHAPRLEPKKGDRVVVAMSGGVDSSVVAKLLSEKDYALTAVFMRNWDTRDESGTDHGCEWEKDWEDVQLVCHKLDIPCKMVDLSRQYWTRVFEPCLDMWRKGYTPNPDIWCNKEVKFGGLVDQLADGDYWLATGHYANKAWVAHRSLISESAGGTPVLRPTLIRPKDRTKDQTYYLSAISEQSLARTIFPLAPFSKREVRELARKAGLPTAARQESMGICFVGEKRRFNDFLAQYITPNPGSVVDLETNRTVGRHQGLWQYTIGQNARISGLDRKAYVARKDLEHNIVYVVPGSDHPALYFKGLVASGFQWIWHDSVPSALNTDNAFHCRVKFGYRTPDVACTVRRGAEEDALRLTFAEPQKHVAPGQVAVVLDGDRVLGCGTIMEPL